MKKIFVFFAVFLLLLTLVSAEKLSFERISYSIAGGQEWMNTLLKVTLGDHLEFTGTGSITTKRGGSLVGPDGQEKADSAFPCPGLPMYGLVGKFGEKGNCFLIGASKKLVPNIDDFLY